MDFDEIMNADRLRKQEAVRRAELAAKARRRAAAAAALPKQAHQAILGDWFTGLNRRR